jgi:CRP/FNR family cyclic AMP-dependent transcriptional regulator
MSSYEKKQTFLHLALRQMTVFHDLGDESLDRIAGFMHLKEFSRGREVIPYKGTGSDVYFLLEGSVRVTTFAFSGKEISYEELSPGAMFGELSAIDGAPRAANVIALEPTMTASISKSDFWWVIHEYPEVACMVLKRLTSMVRFLCDRVYLYGALDVPDRVRVEILRLARKNMTGENIAVIEPMSTHVEIANRINTHREAVTRELNELSRIGLIEKKKKALTVKDVSRLAELLPEDL